MRFHNLDWEGNPDVSDKEHEEFERDVRAAMEKEERRKKSESLRKKRNEKRQASGVGADVDRGWMAALRAFEEGRKRGEDRKKMSFRIEEALDAERKEAERREAETAEKIRKIFVGKKITCVSVGIDKRATRKEKSIDRTWQEIRFSFSDGTEANIRIKQEGGDDVYLYVGENHFWLSGI
ncbi:MAG: hypothetical protein AAB495_03455 [Patescibacteria group bacterium]